MGFSIREMNRESKFASALTVEALSQVIPQSAITDVITLEGVRHQRTRRLTASLTLWIVIALHLYPTVCIAAVLRKLARGLRLVWSDPTIPLPADSAIAARRRQLGARPVVALFKRICKPMAVAQTPGAWLFGLRTVAPSMAPVRMHPILQPTPKPLVATLLGVVVAPFPSFRVCILSNAARRLSSTLAFGPAP